MHFVTHCVCHLGALRGVATTLGADAEELVLMPFTGEGNGNRVCFYLFVGEYVGWSAFRLRSLKIANNFLLQTHTRVVSIMK